MRGDESTLHEFHAPIASLRGGAQIEDLKNIVNAVQGVGGVQCDGQRITIRYDPDYVSEKTLRMLMTKAGYPQADQSPA